MPDGLEVLVSVDFNTTSDANGDILIHPKGDLSAPPSGRMPKGGYFFDTIIRQDEIDEDRLDPNDNLEEFSPISDRDLEELAEDVEAAQQTGRALIAVLGGMAFGDIALVPAPNLVHPKGIRDIAEWYMSLAARPDYIHAVFSRQCEIALGNLERIHARIGDSVDVVMLCGTDFGTQTRAFCSVDTFRDLWFPYYKRINDWIHEHTTWKTFKHSCGSVERFVPSFIECGFDILNPVQCSAANMEPEQLKAKVRRRHRLLGRRRGHAEDPSLRNARGGSPPGPGAPRDLLARRRLRLQHHPQHPSAHSGREHRRDARRRARVQRRRLRSCLR